MNTRQRAPRTGGLRRLAPVILGLAFVTAALAAPDKRHLKISVNATALDGFNNWTAGTPWTAIENFKNGNASRPTVDLVLELQALRAGGLDFDFELERTLTYESAKQEVIDGHVDLTAETIWDDEIKPAQDALFSTPAVIDHGEFVKGIYVLPSNERLLKVTDISGLKNATAVVVSTWALDVKTVQSMPLAGVQKVVTPELGYVAIEKGRADFILDEFSAQPDLHVERGMIKLVPVQGVKVGIDGARCWVVSRKAAGAEDIIRALTAGTETLKRNGTIRRAYTQSGFFNDRVKDWKQIF